MKKREKKDCDRAKQGVAIKKILPDVRKRIRGHLYSIPPGADERKHFQGTQDKGFSCISLRLLASPDVIFWCFCAHLIYQSSNRLTAAEEVSSPSLTHRYFTKKKRRKKTEGELGTERRQAWKQIKVAELCRLTSKRVM